MTKTQMIELVKNHRNRRVNNFHQLTYDYLRGIERPEFIPYVEWCYSQCIPSSIDDFYRSGYDALIKRLELENTKLHKVLE